MSGFVGSYNLPAPRRITASNLPVPSHLSSDPHAEPGVEVRDERLVVKPLLDGSYRHAVIATSPQVPTKNDSQEVQWTSRYIQKAKVCSGELELDAFPGAGIVLPGGLNTYYLDIAPHTEGVLVQSYKLSL